MDTYLRQGQATLCCGGVPLVQLYTSNKNLKRNIWQPAELQLPTCNKPFDLIRAYLQREAYNHCRLLCPILKTLFCMQNDVILCINNICVNTITHVLISHVLIDRDLHTVHSPELVVTLNAICNFDIW